MPIESKARQSMHRQAMHRQAMHVQAMHRLMAPIPNLYLNLYAKNSCPYMYACHHAHRVKGKAINA